jgi:biopolymer transport protein ExbD
VEFASRRRPPLRENVVPLINVVFLLLIFFMLTATLRPADVIDVVLPQDARDAHQEPSDWPVLIVDADGRVDPEDLSQLGPNVELRADANVPARVLLPLLEALDRAGVAEVEVVTRAR